jgi:hypothetical protein
LASPARPSAPNSASQCCGLRCCPSAPVRAAYLGEEAFGVGV